MLKNVIFKNNIRNEISKYYKILASIVDSVWKKIITQN